jgi:hypothetical protein
MGLKKFNNFRINESNDDIDSKILSIFSRFYQMDVKPTDTLEDIGINSSTYSDLDLIGIDIEEELNIDMDNCKAFNNLVNNLVKSKETLTVQDVINTLK